MMASSESVPKSDNLSRWWILAGVIAVIACAVELVAWLRLHPALPRIRTSTQITYDSFPKEHLVTSPDGTQLYFNELSDRSTVARAPTASGVVTPINAAVDDPHVLDITTQSELLIASGATESDNASFWVVSPASGSARRLGEALGHDLVSRPDGRLLFVTGKDLYIVEHDGTNPRKLVTAPGPPFAVHFSPDGLRMRFTIGDPKSRSTMWEAQADGSGMHPILPLPGWTAPPAPCCGQWTPDGRYFAFVDAGRIWVVADRPGKYSEPVQISSGALAFHDLAPSRDGKRLFAIGVQPRAELVRYDATSKQLVPCLGGISAGDVDFSRDGEWVTYISYPDGALWRSKADGSERLRLTSPPMQAASARWSPDGTRIAFSGQRPGERWKVWLISKDGGNPETPTLENIPEADPTWSSDGNALAFVRYSQPSVITFLDLKTHTRSELPGSEGLWRPRWSPDGRFVAALSADSNTLMIYDRSGRKWRQLASDLGTVGTPAWSHDSQYLHFDVTSPHDFTYMRVRASDGKAERLASLKNVRRYLGLWGFWSGLAPGDVPLLARDTGEQEVYALEWRLP
jgi:Tol biopolymer transport system component